MSRNAVHIMFICFILYSAACAQKTPDAKTENLIYVSWGDQIVIATGDGLLDTPEKIQRSITAWKDSQNGQTILWRGSAYYIERFYEQRNQGNPLLAERRKEIMSRFDPLKTARETAKANGQKFLIYLTIFDHGCPANIKLGGKPFLWQDRLTQKHPEYQCVDLRGNYHWGVLELAVPEARQAMIERICDFVKEFDTDGVYVCTRTHSPPADNADQFGFALQIADEFKKRYGVDILTDARFDYKNPNFNPKDPLVEKWHRLRGEYFTEFFAELRKALPGKTIYVGIPLGRYMGPPYGNMYLDWESLVKQKSVDGLVTGVVAGRWLYPQRNEPHAKLGYLCSQDDELNIPSPEDAINKIYGQLCSENNVALFYNPDTNSCDPRFRRMKERCPQLTGFMLNAPDNEFGTGYIEHSKELCFPGGHMTVEAFIMPRSKIPAWRGRTTILSKYDHTENNTRRGWEIIWNASGKISFRVNQASDGTGRGVDCTLETSRELPLNKWTHVACVYDAPAGSMKIYLNGKLSGSAAIANVPPRFNPNQELFVGRYGGRGYMTLFDGEMDELRLSNLARVFASAPAKPYRGDEPGTVALYHFDKVGDNGTIQDAAKNHEFPMFLLNKQKDANLSQSMPGFGKALNMHVPDADAHK